jgi:hypothetical protein
MKYELDFDFNLGDTVYHKYNGGVRKAIVTSLSAEISKNVVLYYGVTAESGKNYAPIQGFELFSSPGKAFE